MTTYSFEMKITQEQRENLRLMLVNKSKEEYFPWYYEALLKQLNLESEMFVFDDLTYSLVIDTIGPLQWGVEYKPTMTSTSGSRWSGNEDN